MKKSNGRVSGLIIKIEAGQGSVKPYLASIFGFDDIKYTNLNNFFNEKLDI